MKVFSTSLATIAASMIASPAIAATVKDGVDAWQQGDYDRAIKIWRPMAQAGDADAQFNMGQAYKLGRGVPIDFTQAIEWYRRAALQQHLRAEDNLGLLMFQQGQRSQAMPYLQRSAERGDARSQYLVATTLYNGDLLTKDWVKAYALMTKSAASGLPQAASSLQEMDKYIPDDQRRRGLAMAAALGQGDNISRIGPQMDSLPVTSAAVRPINKPKPEEATPPLVKPAPPLPAPSSPRPPVRTAAPAPITQTASASASGETWRIQLGAFGEESRARALWNKLSSSINSLSAYQPYLVKAGPITRLQAGPIRSGAEANRLCTAVKATGSDCMPKKM